WRLRCGSSTASPAASSRPRIRSTQSVNGAPTVMNARPGFHGDNRGEKRFETRAEQRIDQLRMPPQSVEAEQAVLGGLMLAPDAYDRVPDQLTEARLFRR